MTPRRGVLQRQVMGAKHPESALVVFGRARRAALAVSLCACGPSVGSSDGSTAFGDASSTGADVTSSGAVTLTSTSVGGDETTTSAGDSTGMMPQSCPPPTAMVQFSVASVSDIDGLCIVAATEWNAGQGRYSFDCDGDLVEVVVTKGEGGVTPQILLDEVVRVRYVTQPVFWVNRWLAISTAMGESDRLLFGALDGSALDPPGTTLDALFAAGDGQPLVAIEDVDCPVEMDECGPVQRRGVRVTMVDGTSATVIDGDVGAVNMPPVGYEIVVGEATDRLEPQLCTDLGPWRSLMLTMFAGD